ncbi:MAG: serine hydrolase [Chitinophagaceae bacterium]|nr:serine hydrolase [Chitinophagaceae bacterium]
MNKTFILSLTFTVFSLAVCYGQATPVTIVRGVVINASTGEPVSYATVTLARKSVSTMSNESGKFIFKIAVGDKQDSIYISHVGYKQVAMVISSSDTGFTVIKLNEDIRPLSEVTVKTINPLNLIRRAIARIPDNYPSTPYIYDGFYRLTGRKGLHVIDLSEAVFQVYNENYSSKNKQYKVVRARLDKDLTAFGGMDGIDFGAKPEGLMEDDIVSNVGGSDLLSEEGLKEHVFTYNGIIDYNGRDAYVIGFDQKDGVKKSLNKGTIYLDAGSLAFLQLTVQKSPKGIKYWGLGFVQRTMLMLANVHARLLGDSGYITYKKYGDKYYLNHVYGSARWYLAGSRKHFELNPMRLTFNCLVTGIDTAGVRAFKKEEVQRNSKLMENHAPEKNTDSTDAFWGDYNLIQAEFNVDSASKIIRANNETLNYKNALARQLSKYKKEPAVRIDSILSFYYHKGQFNGTALVKYQGKVIYSKGFGLADNKRVFPNTAETQFRIGSTSKQFTAMLIMQLVNEGKLSVEDTAGRFIPGYRNGMVTIQQLLTHQSGIPEYLAGKNLAAFLTRKYSLDELVTRFCSDSLDFEPGTKMDYSNSGFVVLADIIEKITGKKYADVLAEKIFTPLGMTHSYFGKEGQDTTRLAIGYMFDEPEIGYPVQNLAGAGGITSTAEDLLLWHNALSANTLLPKEKMDELFKPRVQWDEWGAYYGYGWMIDRLQFEVSKKHTIQYHPGTEEGFYDMLVRQPDKDIFIILLSNHSDFPRFDMTDLILNELN